MTGNSEIKVHSVPSHAAHGDMCFNVDNGSFYVYTTDSSADNHTSYDDNNYHSWEHTVIYPNTWDIGTASGQWDRVYIGEGVTYWVPVKCKCCERDIKERDDGLSILIGKEVFWFHRRCFGDKRNSSFIRALIVSVDLELFD